VDLPAVVGATIDAAGCERPALVGYSMGARAALSLVVDDPARFAGALLESGSPGIVDDAERARRVDADEELARALETQPLSTFVDRWYAQPLFASLARRTSLPSVKAAACTNDAKALARALRGLGTGQMPPLWDALPRLSLPLRLVVGREDARYVAIAQAMRERATHAVVDVIEGAGHNTHIEEPRAFLRALHGFLQQVAR
jgi:2-succinyl-6-hydroxy-2,4-cyclohexadiene-1-carboxylate synthase